MIYTVYDRATQDALARGKLGETVIIHEGQLYFEPAVVDFSTLKRTERTYNCPYKGICVWYDCEVANGRVQSIAWVYEDPKPGYEEIRGKIAFYSKETAGTFVKHEVVA